MEAWREAQAAHQGQKTDGGGVRMHPSIPQHLASILHMIDGDKLLISHYNFSCSVSLSGDIYIAPRAS